MHSAGQAPDCNDIFNTCGQSFNHKAGLGKKTFSIKFFSFYTEIVLKICFPQGKLIFKLTRSGETWGKVALGGKLSPKFAYPGKPICFHMNHYRIHEDGKHDFRQFIYKKMKYVLELTMNYIKFVIHCTSLTMNIYQRSLPY